MIFRATFKTPDVLTRPISDAVTSEVAGRVRETKDLDADDLGSELLAEAEALAAAYVRYGELITVEFNTENQTVTVVPV